MINPNELIHELKQFTGTGHYYKNPLFPMFAYTDGVKYLAEKANAYWLIDYIFGSQFIKETRGEAFQVWKIVVENNQATITVEDGNGKQLRKFPLEFTDFPLQKFELWFTDRILLLPLEY